MRMHIVAVTTAATVAVFGLAATAATAQAQPAGHQPQARPAAAGSRTGKPVTVTGPHMYDPATGKPFPTASTVTVSQATNLVNQMVHVSWTNFTPSSAVVYGPTSTFYPVMVTECKGINPASPADCYGATNAGVTSTSGAFGPMNDAYTATAANGAGQTLIDLFTAAENAFLGCGSTSPCSLAIVPAQGGNFYKTPTDCADHSSDLGFGSGTATGVFDFGPVASRYQCSWAKRIVVPLRFDPTQATCPSRNAAFASAGSPMLARAMSSWLTALCAGPDGMTVNYNSFTGEPAALQDLATGQADVAFTTRTAGSQGISTGSKHYVYAPVAVSAMSLAYWFDDPTTGQPQGGVKLDQRLALKLLTQSYAYENDACVPGQPPPPPPGCDKGVEGDQQNLFTDPEFTMLNPAIAEPVDGAIEVPTVTSVTTDATWSVTRWIDANPAASQFLAGKPDPWQEHLNTYYSGLKYPTSTFTARDQFPVIEHQYTPLFPPVLVATDQVENWPPATNWQKDQSGNFERLPAQIPGQRALIAIPDEGDAAAFLFPTAAVANGAGAYTQPTQAAMSAAVKTMVPAGDGTLQVNLHSSDKAVYPLTMVVYAVVPVSGTSHAKASAIARFLDYAAGAGQTSGVQAGQLPPGFLPLTPAMRAQTRKAAQEVLHQNG